jgi:hypothetical protein
VQRCFLCLVYINLGVLNIFLIKYQSVPVCLKHLVALLSLLLVACGGGGGDGDRIGLADGESPDPVVVDIAIAYVKHPLPLDNSGNLIADDLGDPLAFTPDARLLTRVRAANTAAETDLTPDILAIALIDLNSVTAGSPFTLNDISIDIKDLTTSFDGQTLLFAARIGIIENNGDINTDNTTWNLWRYDLETNAVDYVIASRLLREGEATHPYHDISPKFLPNDKIVFSSTRQKAIADTLLDDGRGDLYAGLDEERDQPALVLHTIDPAILTAEGIEQITFNQSHDIDPFVKENGEIIFTRWDNAPANTESGWNLYKINPSGRQLSLLYGYASHLTGNNGSRVEFFQAQELEDGRLVVLLRPSASARYNGNLVIIDADQFVESNQGTVANGSNGPGQTNLTNNDIRTDDQASPGGSYHAVYPLHDGTNRLFVSWSQCRLQRPGGEIIPCTLASNTELENLPQALPSYGIWLYDPGDDTQSPVILAEEGFIFSDIVAAEDRSFPGFPNDTDSAVYDNDLALQDMALLQIESVYDFDGSADTSSLLNGTSTGAVTIAQRADPALTVNGYGDRPARFIRLVKPVPIPDDDIRDVENFAYGVSRNQLMREIIGYAPIEPDGSVTLKVPANTAFMISVLNENLQRITPRHNVWLQLGKGEILRCVGCHDSDNAQAHGRIDSQLPTINAGAQSLVGGVIGFPNTKTDNGLYLISELLTGTALGQTMADIFDLNRPAGNVSEATHELELELVYSDEWADTVNGQTPDTPLDYSYGQDIAFAVGEKPNENSAGAALSRIVINYIDHIQPIWERARTPISDSNFLDDNTDVIDNCVGCHASTTASGVNRIPAGQLDLTSLPSDLNADQLRSYRELLSGDIELWLDNDTGNIVERRYTCETLDIDGNIIPDPQAATLGASTSSAGSINSSRFFACFSNAYSGSCGAVQFRDITFVPVANANCVADVNGVPFQFPDPNNINNPLVYDHDGLLTDGELRLISEWLDIGAQYLNDPYHPLLD